MVLVISVNQTKTKFKFLFILLFATRQDINQVTQFLYFDYSDEKFDHVTLKSKLT